MDRRRTIRGDQHQRPSVKALGQMFEDLIRISVVGSDSTATLGASNKSHRGPNIKVEIKKIGRILETNEKNGCIQCNKPAVTSLDGNHVKNRKQFFEGQTQAPEKTGEKSKSPNVASVGITSTSKYSINKFEEPPYLKKKTTREICACDVKARRQIFEEYAHGSDNKKSVPAKPVETIAQQQNKFYNDILDTTPIFNNYASMKPSASQQVPNKDKEYVPRLYYTRPIKYVKHENDTNVDMSLSIKNENKPNTKVKERKSITLDFEDLKKKYNSYDEENTDILEDNKFVNYINANYEQKPDKYEIVEEAYTEEYSIEDKKHDNKFEEEDEKINENSNDKDDTDHHPNAEYVDEYEDPDVLYYMASIENLEKIISQDKKKNYPDDEYQCEENFPSFKTLSGDVNKDLIQNNKISADKFEQYINSTNHHTNAENVDEYEDSDVLYYMASIENLEKMISRDRNKNDSDNEHLFEKKISSSKGHEEVNENLLQNNEISGDQFGQYTNSTDHHSNAENVGEYEDPDVLYYIASIENLEKTISHDKNKNDPDEEYQVNKDLIQNKEISADKFEQYINSTEEQFIGNKIQNNKSDIGDENAENYIASFTHGNKNLDGNIEESYEEKTGSETKKEANPETIEHQDILIHYSEETNNEENEEEVEYNEIEESANVYENQNYKDDVASVRDLIEIEDENLKENNEGINYVNYDESADVTNPLNTSSPNLEQNNENIYDSIIQVCSLEDSVDPDDNVESNKNPFLLPENTSSITVTTGRVSEEGYLKNESSPEANIEECISDVTKAFESINALCNQPRWHIWDMAKQQEATTLNDLEDDVFGALLDIDSNFCVETYNNGEENILFKIWYGREVLMQENEYDSTPLNSSVNYDGDLSNKTEEEEAEYTFIDDDDDERDGISGTFFDKDENPRIEIIGDYRSNELHIPHLDITKGQNRIIRELIESEEIYLHNMKSVIENYLQHFRNLEVSSDIEIVFGNVEEICSETEKIYTFLQNCISIDEIARTFLTNVHIFNCYIEYMRNKRTSHKYANEQFGELIKNRQIELDDQYMCESYLLNVMQRPEQYKNILEELRETVTKSGATCEALDEAIVLLDKKIEETNTILAIDSIKYCPIDLKEMEPFLMKETFNIKRKYKSVVFLFKGGVIFCVEDQDEYDIYDYIESIEMDKLAIRHSNSSMSFQLNCFDKSKRCGDESQYEFNIEAPSMAVKEKWVDDIQRILWRQLQYFKDQQKNETILPQNKQQTTPVTYADQDQYIEGFVENGENASAACEDDEYYDMQDVPYEEEREKMSGIFFDKYENPRIEIIRSESLIGGATYMGNIPKSQYMIIKELINTEETYLRKMKHIIDSYYLYFKNMGVPSDIQIVFGNIEDIYNETEKLYGKFLECDSVDSIANVFLDNAHIFDLYTDYMRNKSTSYFYANTKFKELIRDRQSELEDQYTCDSYLLNPVQRPGRYKLLLEKLDKELLKTQEVSKPLRDAVSLVNEKITETNTLMTIDSIQKCPVNLQNMGPFIMKESFNIRRKYKGVIFLFKDIIVFCTEDQSRPDTYIYADSIEMTKLTISHNRFSTSFQLRNFNKSKLGEENKYTFDVEAPSMSVKERWMDEIQRLLWGQLQYFKDQQKRTSLNKISPTMSFLRKGSMKEKRKPYDATAKSRKRSTFYYDIK